MPSTKRAFSIGAVCFAEPVPTTANSAGWNLTHHIGQERIAMLQLLRDGEPLPHPYFLVGQRHGGWEKITPDQIDWETSRIVPSKKVGA
jgi:hypothetical protein